MKKIKRQKIKDVLGQSEDQVEVVVMGWIRTRRDSKGGFSFLEVNDGSCLSNLQVIANHTIDDFDSISKKLYTIYSIHICIECIYMNMLPGRPGKALGHCSRPPMIQKTFLALLTPIQFHNHSLISHVSRHHRRNCNGG